MGSHPTLAHHQLAAEALESDHDDWIHNHHHRPAERTASKPPTSSTPPSASPPTARTASATATSPSARPP